MWSRCCSAKTNSSQVPSYSEHVLVELMAKRLNLFGTINGIVDGTISFVMQTSSVFNTFWTETLPYYVVGLYYLLPGVVPLALIVKDHYDIKALEEEHKEEIEDAKKLIDSLSSEKEFANFLESNPETKANLFEKIAQVNQKNKSLKIDIAINSTYFILRACHGLVLLLPFQNMVSDQESENIATWITNSSSLLSLLYVSARLMHDHIQTLEKYSHSFFNTTQTILRKAKNEVEVTVHDLSEPLLHEYKPT